jgi:uracil-DNA glycosylase
MSHLDALVKEIRACTLCEAHLPLGVRPILRVSESAKLLIIGQAPGTKVHLSGVPWDDASGDRLLSWLEIEKEMLHDVSKIAIVPIGFCYPGRAENGGDNPPRPECAPEWQDRLVSMMEQIQLTLLVGTYAQAHHLGKAKRKTMTETVKNWRDYAPRYMALPHPSWRTIGWQKKNPWFESDVLPALRKMTAQALS